jgi:glycosyltransferase involved in cell wall biosynthesis
MSAGDPSPGRPTLLVFAYSCGPGVGSEPGAGWGMVMALHEIADLIVLTGSQQMERIRQWQAVNPAARLRFLEVSDRYLGKVMRWHRIPAFLLYLLWLRKARRRARHVIATNEVSAVSHVTFSSAWLPTPATALGTPSIWGPMGGGVTAPRPLWPLLGRLGVVDELLDRWTVRTMVRLPATRRSVRNATVRICQNQATLDLLPADLRPGTYIINHATFTDVPSRPAVADGRYVLWVSPMEGRKGPLLALEALARTQEATRLVMIGDGPQRKMLERRAGQLGIADRVQFSGRVDRSEAIGLMRGATTVLFTGLREEGGLALAEAMYSARRIVVLDNGGAGTLARRATDPNRVALVPATTPDEVAAGFAAAIDSHFAAPPSGEEPLLDREASLRELSEAVRQALDG